MRTQSKGVLQHMPWTPSDVEQLNSAMHEGNLYTIVKESGARGAGGPRCGRWRELLEGGGAPVVLPFAIVDNFVIYDNPVRQRCIMIGRKNLGFCSRPLVDTCSSRAHKSCQHFVRPSH